ncbi:MAG: M56 family metallopeptidase [Clostridia bacterium]|nr:M56 family metallopeptidase [Clostridia bacterium]
MTELFYTILNMSISAGILILAVLLLRLFFRRAPKWVSVLLWGLVAVRLILPFVPESSLSLMPKAEWVTLDTFYTEENTFFDSVPADRIKIDTEIVEDVVYYYKVVEPPIEIHRGVSPVFLMNCIWLAGVAAMLVYMLVSYIRVMRCVRGARQFRDNIYTSESVSSPFVLGLIRPRIYLPENMDAVSMSYVIAHEEAHLRRLDHLWKPFGFLLLAVHWFNPLIWIGYILLCRDIEMACDERVVRGMNEEERADYSEALLECSVNRKIISACPLAFGEIGAKARIKTVLNYKKPAFWIVVLAVIASVTAAVCFLTNPITVRNPWVQEYVVGAEGILGQVDKAKYESVSEDFAIGADKYGRAVFKDPRKAFETMKQLYSDGLALIAEEQNLAPISHSNYNLYKKFGWQVTSGTEEAQKQAKFVTNFLDIYENSFAKDKPNTDLPEPTDEEESGKVLASHISKAQLDHEKLEQQLEEIEAHIHAVVNAEIILEYQRKFSSVVCHPDANYVTVFVRDFTEDDIRRFEKVFEDYSYVLVSADAPLTLEDVIKLSHKGYDLTWEDFDRFHYTETGSGLYIRVYEVGENFKVWIGGGSPTGTPMYIYLALADDLDTRIDIRDGGVEEFIEKHADPVAHPESPYDSTDNSVTNVPDIVLDVTLLSDDYDLNHDGIPEQIEKATYVENDSGYTWFELQIKTNDGTIGWKDDAHTVHAGYNSIFVCTLDGKDYLLQYNPAMYQGICGYTYRLFSLDARGNTVTKQERTVNFDINWYSSLNEFDAIEIADFMDEINSLLANSKLLLNTNSALDGIDPENPQDILWWIRDETLYPGYEYDESKTLRDNLLELEKVVHD